jgi:hypothetical protein
LVAVNTVRVTDVRKVLEDLQREDREDGHPPPLSSDQAAVMDAVKKQPLVTVRVGSLEVVWPDVENGVECADALRFTPDLRAVLLAAAHAHLWECDMREGVQPKLHASTLLAVRDVPSLAADPGGSSAVIPYPGVDAPFELTVFTCAELQRGVGRAVTTRIAKAVQSLRRVCWCDPCASFMLVYCTSSRPLHVERLFDRHGKGRDNTAVWTARMCRVLEALGARHGCRVVAPSAAPGGSPYHCVYAPPGTARVFFVCWSKEEHAGMVEVVQDSLARLQTRVTVVSGNYVLATASVEPLRFVRTCRRPSRFCCFEYSAGLHVSPCLCCARCHIGWVCVAWSHSGEKAACCLVGPPPVHVWLCACRRIASLPAQSPVSTPVSSCGARAASSTWAGAGAASSTGAGAGAASSTGAGAGAASSTGAGAGAASSTGAGAGAASSTGAGAGSGSGVDIAPSTLWVILLSFVSTLNRGSQPALSELGQTGYFGALGSTLGWLRHLCTPPPPPRPLPLAHPGHGVCAGSRRMVMGVAPWRTCCWRS